DAFWTLSRAAGPVAALDAIRTLPVGDRTRIKVRTVAGTRRPAFDCLLPGTVVPQDGHRDAEIAVDMDFHVDDGPVLDALELTDGPLAAQDPTGEPWFDDYRTYAWKKFLATLDAGAPRPQQRTMQVDGTAPAGPLRFLTTLSVEGRAAFVDALPSRGVIGGVWTVQMGRQQSTRMPVLSPLRWMTLKHGYMATSRGLVRVIDSVGPGLAAHREVLPVAETRREIAEALRLPQSLDKVTERQWTGLLRAAAATTDDAFGGKAYALMLDAGAGWPEGLTATRCRVGDLWSTEHPDREIAVTADRAEYDALLREAVPALLVPSVEVADRMIAEWEMLRPSDVITKEVRFVAQAEPLPLLDLFPHLRTRYRAQVEGWTLTRCGELEEVTRTPRGMRTSPIPHAEHEQSVLVLRPADDLAALQSVDSVLRLGLGTEGCRSIIARREQQRENEQVRQIRTATTTEEKILGLIGVEQLRAGLPAGLEENERARTGAEVPDARVAELALKTHGDAILRHHSRDIQSGNEEAPRTFAGSTAARRYVAELGFDESFAGFTAVSPPDMEEVDGPADLPELHDYQERVVSRIVDLLLQPQPGRAMLRLPTGAGKTRVAVDAIIRVASRGGLTGPILWIAQSDELCEQAVGTWKFVWSKAGPSAQLTINRFWGGNDAAPVKDTTQLVVATDAQLNGRLDR
ncbi:MAG: DEAD/DEAH box helicase family protein, partial [Tomitella sp.]|nr:DEAD/DEAH box helicase family protein [Tomitella sp.]